MRAILYDPDDLTLVVGVGNIVSHALQGCPDCSRHMHDPESRPYIVEGIAALDANSSEDLSIDDLGGVLDYCTAWMNLHTSLRLLDTVSMLDKFGNDFLTVEIVDDPKR